MRFFDEFARQLEANIRWALKPVARLLEPVERYMMSHDASPLGQTLIISPALVGFFVTCLAIDPY